MHMNSIAQGLFQQWASRNMGRNDLSSGLPLSLEFAAVMYSFFWTNAPPFEQMLV